MPSSHIKITISYQSIFRVVLVLIGLAFLYTIRAVLGLLIVSVILAAAINPWVTWLQKRKIPRGLAILVIYLVLFVILGITIAALIPPLKEQVGQLKLHYPVYYEALLGGDSSNSQIIGDSVQGVDTGSLLRQFSFGAAQTVWDVGGGAFGFFSMLVLIFYMTLKENGLEHALGAVVPRQHREKFLELFGRIQLKMWLWLRAQLFLMLVVGAMTFIGLKILGVKYALLLSLVAGLTELIPFVGPIIGAIPAIFVALNMSFMKAILVAVLYVLVQWSENNILVPRFMRRAVGLNPVVVIAAILVGFEFGGVMGAIVAVPVAAALAVVLSDVFNLQAIEENVFRNRVNT